VVPERTFDEFTALGDTPIGVATTVLDALGEVDTTLLARRQRTADMIFAQGGVTFSVYSDSRGVEKVFPFDLVPRPIAASEWERVERGLKQRVLALNLFLADVYGPQKILTDRVIAPEVIERCAGYTPSVRGIVPRGGVYVHIAGIDLVRDSAGVFRVLEDNLRCPSGVSYVLENRAVMKRMFPRAFERLNVRPVETYPMQLREAMRSLSTMSDESAAILTPGPYNSAYFEHGFLARATGTPLVHNTDLVVHDDRVFVRTTRGLQPIDVIYRRTDDEFLDPDWFRADSLLGVPGLMRAYAAGNVALMNAVGNGVADDKAVYPYVPDIIRYYLGEDALIEQVETFRCSEPDALSHVLANLDRLVVKRVDGAGGYGMLVGPTSTVFERDAFARVLRAEPDSYVAQPLVELSTCPVFMNGAMCARRVDLRPYVITGANGPWVLPGGLTRVALKEGSYVVNSSQGGGSKDTWIVEDRS
jgi:uncharacterized circularly permuted ATP-grasp superfamily protein